MPRPTDVRPLIDELVEEGREALFSGDDAAFTRIGHRLLMLMIARKDAEAPLTRSERPAKVNGEQMTMPAPHRIALAKGQEPKDRKFHDAIGKAGYTLNSLAKAVGMSPAALSMARKKRDGKPMRKGKAEQVQALTGWPADAWPRLIGDEE